ncbi:MAG: uridine kinase [Actinomycetota bacterium]|nr:uridine kinase [Actinomycetota bacterium]MDK1016159.1 uridine kinase [Actinomycetota bacterium]MDK1027529.1 uridine kinase [Actinomycetota bacterium]MDK1038690.1 uridine kinase [Actinomycetota bacterium]MDK1096383.1 uridine kinase [Actinomycetota bacterium]
MTIDISEFVAEHQFGPAAGEKRPLFVAIAGGSGSGKTTIARSVVDLVGRDKVVYLQQDAYYRDQAHLAFEDRLKINYDHPDSIELELLVEHLQALRNGQAIERPIYDFETHTRTDETLLIAPEPAVIVEGILLLADPDLRDCFDVRVYIDTEPDVRLMRRIQRDIVERGRSVESVLAQYEKTVRPMHHQFVEPSKRYADIIIPEGINTGAIGTVSSMIRHFLAQRR